MKRSDPEGQNGKDRETVSRDTGFLYLTFPFLLAGKFSQILPNFPELSRFLGLKRLASRENAGKKGKMGKSGTFQNFPFLSLQAKESLGGSL